MEDIGRVFPRDLPTFAYIGIVLHPILDLKNPLKEHQNGDDIRREGGEGEGEGGGGGIDVHATKDLEDFLLFSEWR